MADGRVEFEIVGNDKNINSTIKNVTASIEKESKKWDGAAANAADGASGSWAAAAGKIAGALSAAGVVSILAKWGKAAIESASDLAEVQNVVDVTFGEGASKIESWSKAAGKAFGLTETQAKKYTSTLGAMMKSSGLAQNEITDKHSYFLAVYGVDTGNALKLTARFGLVKLGSVHIVLLERFVDICLNSVQRLGSVSGQKSSILCRKAQTS